MASMALCSALRATRASPSQRLASIVMARSSIVIKGLHQRLLTNYNHITFMQSFCSLNNKCKMISHYAISCEAVCFGSIVNKLILPTIHYFVGSVKLDKFS